MRRVRYAAAAVGTAAALAVAGCGGGGHGHGGTPTNSGASGTVTAVAAPVSVSVMPSDVYARHLTGIVGVEVHNDGPARTSAVVALSIDVPAGRKVAVLSEVRGDPKADARSAWTPVAMAAAPGAKAGHATFTGAFSASLPHGMTLLRFELIPLYPTAAEGEKVPVRVTVTDEGRTLASSTRDASLAALSVTSADGPEGGLLHRHRWTTYAYTLTNESSGDFPRVGVSARFQACSQDSPASCETVNGPCLTADFRTQIDTGSGWRDVAGRRTLRLLTTALPAGSQHHFRLRIVPTRHLPHRTDRVNLDVWSSGRLRGAARPSQAIDSLVLTFE